jgi:hypothetical protein
MRRRTPSALRVAIFTPQQCAQDPNRKSLDAKLKAQLEGLHVSPGPWTLCSPVGSCEPADTKTYASFIESAPRSAGMLRLLLQSATASSLFPSPRVMQAKQKVKFKTPTLLCRNPEKKTSRYRMVFHYHSGEEFKYHFLGNSIALRLTPSLIFHNRINPRLAAIASALTLSRAPNFLIMCVKWFLTVSSVMNSRCPISRIRFPLATRARTSTSLDVRPWSPASAPRRSSVGG